MRALVQLLTVSVLVLSLGLHWAVLQTAAWTGMIITYSSGGSLAEALAKTFDGQHPCALCKAIKKGCAEEKRPEKQQTKPGTKLDLGLLWQATTFHLACERERVAAHDSSGTSRADEPPKPRPRALLDENRTQV